MAPHRGQLWQLFLVSAQNGPLSMGAPVKTVKVAQILFQFLDRVVVGVGWGAAALSCWCRLCHKAACQLWRLLEEFPVLRGRLVALFALGNLDIAFALVSFSSSGVSVLLVEYVVFGTRALLGSTVDTCSTGGLDEFQHLLRCGELES